MKKAILIIMLVIFSFVVKSGEKTLKGLRIGRLVDLEFPRQAPAGLTDKILVKWIQEAGGEAVAFSIKDLCDPKKFNKKTCDLWVETAAFFPVDASENLVDFFASGGDCISLIANPFSWPVFWNGKRWKPVERPADVLIHTLVNYSLGGMLGLYPVAIPELPKSAETLKWNGLNLPGYKKIGGHISGFGDSALNPSDRIWILSELYDRKNKVIGSSAFKLNYSRYYIKNPILGTSQFKTDYSKIYGGPLCSPLIILHRKGPMYKGMKILLCGFDEAHSPFGPANWNNASALFKKSVALLLTEKAPPGIEIYEPPSPEKPAPDEWSFELSNKGDKKTIELNGQPMWGWLHWAVMTGPSRCRKFAWMSEAGMNTAYYDGIDIFPLLMEGKWGILEMPWKVVSMNLKSLEKWGYWGIVDCMGNLSTYARKKFKEEELSRSEHFVTTDILSPRYLKIAEDFIDHFVKETLGNKNIIYGIRVPGIEQGLMWGQDWQGMMNYAYTKMNWHPYMTKAWRKFMKKELDGNIVELRRLWNDDRVNFENLEPVKQIRWWKKKEGLLCVFTGPEAVWTAVENEIAPPKWYYWVKFRDFYIAMVGEKKALMIRKRRPGAIISTSRVHAPYLEAPEILRNLKYFDLIMGGSAYTWTNQRLGWTRRFHLSLATAAKHSPMAAWEYADVLDDHKQPSAQIIEEHTPLTALSSGGLVLGLTDVESVNVSGLVKAGKPVRRRLNKDFFARIGIFQSLHSHRRASPYLSWYQYTEAAGLLEIFSDELPRHYTFGNMYGGNLGGLGERPVLLCFDELLEDLYDFNLIFVPYNAIIPSWAEKELDNFVKNGGLVIGEAGAGVADETATVRKNAALKCFGIKAEDAKILGELLPVRSPNKHKLNPKLVKLFHPRSGLAMGGPSAFGMPEFKISVDRIHIEKQVLAKNLDKAVLPVTPGMVRKQKLRTTNPMDIIIGRFDDGSPAVIMSRKGRACYIGTTLFGRYFRNPFLDEKQRQDIGHFIENLTNNMLTFQEKDMKTGTKITVKSADPGKIKARLLREYAEALKKEATVFVREKLWVRAMDRAWRIHMLTMLDADKCRRTIHEKFVTDKPPKQIVKAAKARYEELESLNQIHPEMKDLWNRIEKRKETYGYDDALACLAWAFRYHARTMKSRK